MPSFEWVDALRGVMFHGGGGFRRVVSVGHSLGSALAVEEAGTYHDGVYSPPATNPSIDVDVPVLLATGSHDSLFCGIEVSCESTSQVVANETPYWPNAPRFDVQLVPLAGHDVNLHRTAPVFFVRTQAWIAANAD